MPDVCTSEDVLKNFEFLFKNGKHDWCAIPQRKMLDRNSCFDFWIPIISDIKT